MVLVVMVATVAARLAVVVVRVVLAHRPRATVAKALALMQQHAGALVMLMAVAIPRAVKPVVAVVVMTV